MRKKQFSFPSKGRGGWRPNAGRPRGSGVTHHGRDAIDKRHPVHLIWRTVDDAPSLRRNAVYPKVVGALRRYSEEEDFRIVFACVLGNHLHLLGECDSGDSLTHAMLCLGTSIAMRVNRTTGHRGPVFDDRYFVRPLRTPKEVACAVAYVLGNEKHHGFEVRDLLAFAQPGTWLLRAGWKRASGVPSDVFGAAEQHCDVVRKGS